MNWWLYGYVGCVGWKLLRLLNSANKKAKNAKLKNDLLTVDSAIQLYKMEKGKCPEKLEDLVSEYIARNKGFQDATNTVFYYAIADNGLNYILKGNDAEGKEVVSDGSKQS